MYFYCDKLVDCHFQGSAHFIFNISDVNDNAPVFDDLEYFGTVAEEQPIGTSATLVCVLCDPNFSAQSSYTHFH